MGMSRGAALPSGADLSHRVQLRHWSGVCRGGVHLVTVYLYDGEGLSRRNLDILQELAFVLSRLRGPWILAGDFNLTPEDLETADWLARIDGVTVAPEGPTCGGRCLDFFVVPRLLRPYVVVVQRLEGSGIATHDLVRLLLRGNCRGSLVRSPRTPLKIAACLPRGCLTQRAATAEAVALDDPDAQLAGTCGLAEAAAVEILSIPAGEQHKYSGRANGCSYVLRPYALPRADTGAKMSQLEVAWRIGGSALRKLQSKYGGAAWWNGVRVTLDLLSRTSL